MGWYPGTVKERLTVPRAALRGAVWRYPGPGGPREHRCHCHDELEFNVVTAGWARYDVDGHRVDLAAGAVCWLFPGQPHQLGGQSADFAMWIVVVAPDLLARTCTTPATAPLLEDRPAGGPPVSQLTADRARWLDDRLEEVAASTGEPARHNAALAYAALGAWAATTEDSDPRLSPAVARACRLLDEPREPPWTVPLLARAVGLSAAQLTRTFRAQTGRTIGEHRRHRQLERFLELYGEGRRMSVVDAAHAAGFGSYAQFHRVFTARMGCSPREYRNGLPPRPPGVSRAPPPVPTASAAAPRR